MRYGDQDRYVKLVQKKKFSYSLSYFVDAISRESAYILTINRDFTLLGDFLIFIP